jgi:hypothetical protein
MCDGKVQYVRLEVFAVAAMKNAIFRDVARVRTDTSEECITSIIRVKRIGDLGTLAVTSHLTSSLETFRT